MSNSIDTSSYSVKPANRTENATDSHPESEVNQAVEVAQDPPNILIVDDNPTNLKVLSGVLEKAGYRVRPALGGSAALKTIDRLLPDLILLDIRMPDMDGYAVCERLKSQGETASIPVIFISAMDAVEDKVKAFDAGGVDYITKPFQFTEVLARVNTQLSLSQTRRELESKNEALAEARDFLEERVQKRTADLNHSNVQLTVALAERDCAMALTERQKNLYHALSEINLSVLRLDNPGALYQAATRIAVEFAGFDRAWVICWDEGASGEIRADYVGKTQIPVSMNQELSLIRNENSVLQEQQYRIFQRACHAAETTGVVGDTSGDSDAELMSIAAFPLFFDRVPIATFNMCTLKPDMFDGEIIALLNQMSGNISYGLTNYARDRAQQQFNAMLQKAVSGMGGATGKVYFERLVRYLAESLDLEYCAIALLDQARTGVMTSVAFVEDGRLAPNFSFPIAGTAAEAVINAGSVTYPKDVASLFPEDQWLRAHQVNSYAGVPVRGREGAIMGVLSVMSRNHFDLSPILEGILELFALRLGTEYERLQVEEALRNNAEELERLVNERTSELQAANQELESFSYTVSHDLRAPLRALDGFSAALIEDYSDQLDEQARMYLGFLQESSAEMTALVDGLLELSRSARSELHVDQASLSAIATSTLNELRVREPERQVEVVIAPDLSDSGDPRLLNVVLTNLLENAWKYSAGEAKARIEFGITRAVPPVEDGTDSESQPSEPLRCYFVRDNGAGFNMEYSEKLFLPFQRLHRADEFQGTGIGLATVKRIIARHGGTIWAESEIGKGATFYFTLNARGSRDMETINQ